MKVVGCPNGMDSDDPHLPTKPCMAVCDWRIKSIDFCNCSWVVAETTDGIYDLRKLGEMTGMSHESVRTLVNKTISKLSAQQSESLEGGQEEKIIKRLLLFQKEGRCRQQVQEGHNRLI